MSLRRCLPRELPAGLGALTDLAFDLRWNAGDHLKITRDLGLPPVGVGLLCQQGHFRQRPDARISIDELPPAGVRTGVPEAIDRP